MNFGENLINLRKANNMSQEALAERLGVSRQTIYKWENGVTYPDMAYAMDIAKIFNVSVDTLMNDEAVSDVSKDDIIKRTKAFSYGIAGSVFLIMLGVALQVLLGGLCKEPIDIVGTVLMLTCIFTAVLIMIFVSVRFDAFKKEFEPKIEFSKQEKIKEHGSFTRNLVLGIGLIFVGILQLIFLAITDDDFIMIISTSVLLALIGLGVFFIIYAGIMHDLYEKGNEFLIDDAKKPKSKLGWLCGIIMICAVVAFLVWGFLGGWEISWICFPVGGLLCGIVSIIEGAIYKKDNE